VEFFGDRTGAVLGLVKSTFFLISRPKFCFAAGLSLEGLVIPGFLMGPRALTGATSPVAEGKKYFDALEWGAAGARENPDWGCCFLIFYA